MEIFSIVEEMPKFPGGEAELFKYLGKAMSYPKCPGEEPPSTIMLSFIVRYDGSLCGVEVKRGVTCEDHEEKLRSMVLAMPPWEPGRQRGHPVNVQYHLPFRINLK
jgi:periplasmic protein TonB